MSYIEAGRSKEGGHGSVAGRHSRSADNPLNPSSLFCAFCILTPAPRPGYYYYHAQNLASYAIPQCPLVIPLDVVLDKAT